MALSNGITGEFLSPVPISGKLNLARGVTVNHTDGQWLVIENVYLLVCTEKRHYGGLVLSEIRRYNSPQWQDLATHSLF